MADYDKFLYSYVLFLFFIIFILSIGGTDYFVDNNLDTIGAPPQPLPPSETDTFITGFLGTAGYYIALITYFFQLLSVDIGVQFITLLVITPASIVIIWNLIKMIRGTS